MLMSVLINSGLQLFFGFVVCLVDDLFLRPHRRMSVVVNGRQGELGATPQLAFDVTECGRTKVSDVLFTVARPIQWVFMWWDLLECCRPLLFVLPAHPPF